MAISLWLSFALSAIIYFIISAFIWSIPETKNNVNSPPHIPSISNTEEPLIPAFEAQVEEDAELNEEVPGTVTHGTQPWMETLQLVMTRNPSIILFCFFMKRIGYTSYAFLPQYASERFHMILRQTPWFNWAEAFGSTLALGFLLPSLTVYMRRKEISVRKRDLIIINGSLLILIVAYFIISQASLVVVFGAGESDSYSNTWNCDILTTFQCSNIPFWIRGGSGSCFAKSCLFIRRSHSNISALCFRYPC